jgi:hypothetical protein
MHHVNSPVLGLSFSSQVSPRQIGKCRKALIQAIEEGLSTFGESVPEIVFHNLDKKFSLDKDKIIDQPDSFTKALYTMFGSGAATVEKVIVKSVCEILRIKSLSPATFCDCIDIVKSRDE